MFTIRTIKACGSKFCCRLLGTYFEFSCIPATIFFLSISAGNCSVKNVRILFDILDTFQILSIFIIYN